MASESTGILKEKKNFCIFGKMCFRKFCFGMVLEFHIRVPKSMNDT